LRWGWALVAPVNVNARCRALHGHGLANHRSGYPDNKVRRPVASHRAGKLDHSNLARWRPEFDPWKRTRNLNPVENMLNALEVSTVMDAKVWVCRVCVVSDQFCHALDPLRVMQGVEPAL